MPDAGQAGHKALALHVTGRVLQLGELHVLPGLVVAEGGQDPLWCDGGPGVGESRQLGLTRSHPGGGRSLLVTRLAELIN